MLSFKINVDVDQKNWNDSLLNSKYSTFFQTKEYLESENEFKFPIFIEIFENTNLLGQLGLVVIKIKKAYSGNLFQKLFNISSKLGNRATWVSGPIIHNDNKQIRLQVLETILNAIDHITKKYNIMLVDGYSPPQDLIIDEDYLKIFQNHGYDKTNFVTWASELNVDIDQLWTRIKKNAKNDVTKAKRENIIIKEISDEKELVQFLLLGQKWSKTKGIEVNDPLETLQKDLKIIKSKSQKLFLAYANSEPVAGLRIGCFNGIAYTHQVINAYSKSGNVAGPLLTWNAITWAKNNGLKLYDFSGGEDIPKNNSEKESHQKQWMSLFDYKKKWGGNEYPYYHFVKVANKTNYKIYKVMTKSDWIYRNYKKTHYTKPKKK